MFLVKLLHTLESIVFSIPKTMRSFFGIEQARSAKTGDILINSKGAYDLYHNDLTPNASKKQVVISATLWVFILVISFLNFVI